MKSFLIVIFNFCLFSAAAQHQLTGTVKDKADGSPVPYATAALMRADSSIITGVMTNDEGEFVIENIATGSYLLQVSFIGYEKAYRQVSVPVESDLGEIFLSESVNRLDEVVVTAKRALVEQRLDRIVVNVSGNMITSGLNINDLLKQLPGLIVDQDGSVKLNGRSAIVYIDGRPTRLPQEQVAQMLTGMMGDVVDRVELIDNPSSRYEAGMGGAIVNIRMKRDASLGLNGTVQAGAGYTEHDFAWRSGLNLNYRSKKLNIFGNYGYNDIPMYYDVSQVRNYGGTQSQTYDQYSLVDQKMPVHTLRAGIDWFIAPKQTIGFLFNGSNNKLNMDFTSRTTVSPMGISKIDSTILSDIWSNTTNTSQMYNLNYRLDGEKRGVLSADLDYGRVHSKQTQDMQSRYQNADGGVLRPSTEFRNQGPRDIDILSFKLDYSKPLSDNSNLETGVKTGQTVTDNEIIYENLNDEKWVIDLSQSNQFKYTEQISAAYVTYSHRFGKFSAMAGLRAEYTSTKGESSTMDTTFKHSYLDWFPSAYIQYQINKKQGLNLSYSRKITRPGYSLLNPFRIYADPFTYSSGNPDLKPSYHNTLALRYNIGSYSANLSYSKSNDVFEQDYEQDDEGRMMGLIQKNVEKKEQLTLGINVPVKAAKWYSLNLYTQAAYMMVDTRHDGVKFQKNYLSAYVGMNHNVTFSPSFRANLQIMWMKPTYSGVVRLDDMWGTDAQIEKTFLDKRLSLSLSCKDVFSTSNNVKGKIKIGNIDQAVRQEMNMRQIMLTARYSFGSQQIRGARNRKVGIEEEMGRAR